MTTNVSKAAAKNSANRSEDDREQERKARARSANADVPSPQAGSTPPDEHPDDDP